MSAINAINPNAERTRQAQALAINCSAARGLAEVVKTNLGPRGTLKMLVDGSGQVKLTKDGGVLLHEMQIQHPTAIMIARTATAQDDGESDRADGGRRQAAASPPPPRARLGEPGGRAPAPSPPGRQVGGEPEPAAPAHPHSPPLCPLRRPAFFLLPVTGDGTTSSVLFTGELLKYAERYISEGVHPRIIADGFELAQQRVLPFLERFKIAKPGAAKDRELLASVARTSLRTKLQPEMADHITDIVTDAVLCVQREGQPIDLHMIERMHMLHRTDNESRLVKGLVLDHGSRHPDMPISLENCHILIANISLEYEKTEVTSTFTYSNAGERERMVEAERRFTDAKVRQIVELKRRVCTPENKKSFVIINQKGIDPFSLDLLAKEGVIALRRAKRRNAERLQLACGGYTINSADDLSEACLGYAGKVYEVTLGEDKFTFVEDCAAAQSCTILLKGPNEHTIAQLKDAVRDGMRAVVNTIEDAAVVPGAGSFEVAAAEDLRSYAMTEVTGKVKLGVLAFADALMVVPKVLAENSGFDMQETIIMLQEQRLKLGGAVPVGLDCQTGGSMLPVQLGIYDNVRVKKQIIQLGTVLASQLLLVDEVLRAGRGSRGGQ